MQKARTIRRLGSCGESRQQPDIRKSIPVAGGAPKFGKGQPWAIAADGGRLSAVRGTYADAYKLTRSAEGVAAERVGRSEPPGAVLALAVRLYRQATSIDTTANRDRRFSRSGFNFPG